MRPTSCEPHRQLLSGHHSCFVVSVSSYPPQCPTQHHDAGYCVLKHRRDRHGNRDHNNRQHTTQHEPCHTITPFRNPPQFHPSFASMHASQIHMPVIHDGSSEPHCSHTYGDGPSGSTPPYRSLSSLSRVHVFVCVIVSPVRLCRVSGMGHIPDTIRCSRIHGRRVPCIRTFGIPRVRVRVRVFVRSCSSYPPFHIVDVIQLYHGSMVFHGGILLHI